MFGRHRKDHPDEEDELEVDAGLEGDISDVERSVVAYLEDPTDDRCHDLLVALGRLDDQIALGDAYQDTVGWLTPLGVGNPEVLGETNTNPIAQAVSSAEFQAQVVLVKAAKTAVTEPTPDTLDDLRRANDILTPVRAQEQPAGDTPE